jgi:RND family efflux transporter MFP subunit
MRVVKYGKALALGVFWVNVCVGNNAESQPIKTTYDCLIEPAQVVELASPVTGVLDHVLVKRGDKVNKGQVLAQLESHAEQAAADLSRYKSEQTGPVHAAENKIEFSKRKFDRRDKLVAENLMAAQEKDDAEAEYKLAQSEREVAQENRKIAGLEYQQQKALLALRTLRSPFKGVVVEQLAYPGEVVEPGTGKKAVFKLAQLDPLRVHIILPKGVFGELTPGMQVDVAPEIPAGSHYQAKVVMVDRLIDAASGTFVAILDLPNPHLDIPAGVKCSADIPALDKAK